MTFEEIEKWQLAVIASAKDWVDGKACIGGPKELVVIADYYKVDLQPCFRHFVKSNSPNHATTTGATKTILKTLKKLANKIKKE